MHGERCSPYILYVCVLSAVKRDVMAVSAELSTLDVVNALERLSIEETRDLVFRLKVPGNILDNIDAQYRGATRGVKYVEEWLKRDEDASWEKLVSGLKQIKMNAVAKKVESTFISKGKEAPVPATGSARLVSATPPPQPSVDTPAHLEVPDTVALTTATLVPLIPAINPTQPPAIRVAVVKAAIEKFEEEFIDLKFDAQVYLSERESQDLKFLARFQNYLLELSVSKRTIHITFFHQHKSDIRKAENIEMIFDILREYCSYFNYDIILHLIKKFCDAALKKRMLDYRDSFQSFEINTTIDIYLAAISACPEMYKAFSEMATKINKPGNECTLYDVRQVKEAIAKAASLHSYSVYIDRVAKSSVLVVLRIPQSCVVWVGVAMTPEFMKAHHLMEVSIDGKDITFYQSRKYLVCYISVLPRPFEDSGPLSFRSCKDSGRYA